MTASGSSILAYLDNLDATLHNAEYYTVSYYLDELIECGFDYDFFQLFVYIIVMFKCLCILLECDKSIYAIAWYALFNIKFNI